MISAGSAAWMKCCALSAYLFVGLGGALGEKVDAAMDVRAVLLVEARDGVDDGLRLLRGGGIVEIDERLAVNRLMQRGEVFAECSYVEPGGADRGCAHSASSDCFA